MSENFPVDPGAPRPKQQQSIDPGLLNLIAGWRELAEAYEPDWLEDGPWDNWDQEADSRVAAAYDDCAYRLEVALGLVAADTESSASRQHYIETGRYLAPSEEV